MNIKKQLLPISIAAAISTIALTGCSATDKNDIKETAEQFLSAVASGNTDEINKYSSSEVATGNFVMLFDSDYLVEEFKSGYGSSEMDEETSAKLDEFCSLFSDMIEEYSVTNVAVEDNGQGTAVATIKTAFPINVIESDDALEQIDAAVTAYYTDNETELATLIDEQGQEAAEAKIYNDMTLIVLDIYESIIASSEQEVYAIALTLDKNAETDEWYVVDVLDYDTYTDPDAAETATETTTD